MNRIRDVDHVARFQWGVCVLLAGAVIGVIGKIIFDNPVEVAQGIGLIVGVIALAYVAGYAATIAYAISPWGRARAAEEAEGSEADRVPTAMVVLSSPPVDGKFLSSVCTVFGETTELAAIVPGSFPEIVAQAQAISDSANVRAFCIFDVHAHRSFTYLKTAGQWELRHADVGSTGVGRLSKRAADHQDAYDILPADQNSAAV